MISFIYKLAKEMNDKMLKQVMQKVSGLYTSTSLNPLTFYVEKSAYATKK
jgi:hypothetical protein